MRENEQFSIDRFYNCEINYVHPPTNKHQGKPTINKDRAEAYLRT